MVAAALVAAVACSAVAGACSRGPTGGGGAGRLEVVAAFYPLAAAAREVGGDRVRVFDLTPAGAEAHDLELTSEQVDRLEDATVVLLMGRGLQPAVEEAARRARGRVVDLMDRADPVVRGGATDPHVWLDPVEMARMVGEVRDALSAADPAAGPAYASAAGSYLDSLRALDAAYRGGLADCARRRVVTAHAAFGYLARRYGLTEVALAGLAPEAGPDPRRLAQLADEMRSAGDTTVFAESSAPSAPARTLAREAGAATAVLDPLETLAADRAAAGHDYLSVMGENLAALRRGLGCR